MGEGVSNLFRAESVKSLRNPEQLDTFVKLTSPVGWVALAFIGLILLIVTVWGFVGSIPIQVKGLGVVITKDSLSYNLVSRSAGTVKEISVKVGERVTKGTPILTLEFPLQDVARDNTLKKLDNLKKHLARQQEFSNRDIEQRTTNTQRIIASLEKGIANTQKTLRYQKALLATQNSELSKGYVTRQQVEDIRTKIYSLEEEIRTSRDKIDETRTDLIEFENASQKALAQIEQEILLAQSELEEQDARKKVDEVIYSPDDGIIAEIDVKLGSFVTANDQVAVVETSGNDFQALSFFKIKDGKKIKPDMLGHVSPTSVERDLYGSIRGKVISIGTLPETEAGLKDALGSTSLMEEMSAGGAILRVVIDLEENPDTFSGLNWTSSKGPSVKITAATTATTSVTIKEEKPINLVIPIFKAWALGQ